MATDLDFPDGSFTPEMAAMLERATRRRYASGEAIVREGEECKALCCIVSGAVSVWVTDSHGGALILAELGPGQFFGELDGLGASLARSASVRARSECEIATITYQNLQDSIQRTPVLLQQLIGQAARRLRARSR